MIKQNYEVIVNVNGRSVREYSSNSRTFIEAREGTEYTIKINNTSWNRALAVVSVDGVDVINGGQATVHNDAGYIVPAYGSIEIKGFRHSSEEVAAFKFVKKQQSSAAALGNGGNEGVIGVSIFAEKLPPVQYIYNNTVLYSQITDNLGVPYTATPNWTTSAANTSETYSCNMSMNSDSPKSFVDEGVDPFKLGSSWGQNIKDKVQETTFERSHVTATFEIFYTEKSGLEALGITLLPKKEVVFPNAAPKKFSSPPPTWNSR
jgi:hypothetical protein